MTDDRILVESGASTPNNEYGNDDPRRVGGDGVHGGFAGMIGNKRASSDWERRQLLPPGLPPHLEKVPLNART